MSEERIELETKGRRSTKMGVAVNEQNRNIELNEDLKKVLEVGKEYAILIKT